MKRPRTSARAYPERGPYARPSEQALPGVLSVRWGRVRRDDASFRGSSRAASGDTRDRNRLFAIGACAVGQAAHPRHATARTRACHTLAIRVACGAREHLLISPRPGAARPSPELFRVQPATRLAGRTTGFAPGRCARASVRGHACRSRTLEHLVEAAERVRVDYSSWTSRIGKRCASWHSLVGCSAAVALTRACTRVWARAAGSAPTARRAVRAPTRRSPLSLPRKRPLRATTTAVMATTQTASMRTIQARVIRVRRRSLATITIAVMATTRIASTKTIPASRRRRSKPRCACAATARYALRSAHDEVGLARTEQANGDVGLTLGEVDGGVVDHQLEPQRRLRACEGQEPRRQPQGAEPLGGRDADARDALGVVVVGVAERSPCALGHAADIGQDLFAGLRQRDAMCAAKEQARAERLLECEHLSSGGRLADAEHARGAGEAAGFDHRQQHPEAVPVELAIHR